MPRKQKKAPKTKSNGIRWTAARRKAHGKKIQAGRKPKESTIVVKYTHTGEAKPNGRLGITEAIRAKVRAILPEIIDQELAALLKP